jgi:2-dehydro-3-deoxygluconokinase
MRVCCAGEVMVEMAAAGEDGLYRRGVAGDSYNTAVYLARAGLPVSYLTRLGDDSFSDEIIRSLSREGIVTELVTRCAGRLPGLYVIDNDASGERRFSYWREHSPARDLFDEAAAPGQEGGFDVFYLTGITLAVTRGAGQSGRDNLAALLSRLRDGNCRIVFDPNYRSGLWDSPEQAQESHRAILGYCDTVLATLEDDEALWGQATAESCRQFYADLGVREVVVRDTRLRALASAEGEQVERQAGKVAAVDTTGAGDAFNAGYLAVRLRGGGLDEALAGAQALAARVVQHRGAILPALQKT